MRLLLLFSLLTFLVLGPMPTSWLWVALVALTLAFMVILMLHTLWRGVLMLFLCWHIAQSQERPWLR